LAGAAYHHRYDTADWLPDTFGGRSLVGGFDSYRSDNAQRRIYRVIERQYKEARWVEHFVNLDTGDMRVVPDTWSRNRIAYVLENYGPLAVVRKKIDQIRWTASTDILTLHDEISPYRHFTPIPFFPFFMHGMTIGIVENLISPQELLNKSVSQELHVINTTANSGWKLKNGSLQNMTVEELEERGAEDGLTLVLNQTADAEKITPNSIPTGLDRVSFKADEALKEVSMVSDSMRGFDRADVAARAIQAKQARGTVSLAPALNNLDYTRRLVARNTLDLLQSFYTEPRVIQMAGRDLAAEQEPIVINQQTPEGTVIHDLTIGEYSIVLSTVPARESFQQTQFQEAIEMRKVGIAVPDDVIVEHSHLQRKMEVAKRIKELNGGVEPSEEEQQMQQQLQALEMRVKQAEVAEREADAQLKQANAQLSMARAQREASGEGGEKQADPRIAQLEQVKLQAEIQYKQRELELKQRELELKERVAMAELRLKSMDSAQRELLENKKLEASKEKAQQKPSPKPKAPEKTNG
jgi:hypothetical protein